MRFGGRFGEEGGKTEKKFEIGIFLDEMRSRGKWLGWGTIRKHSYNTGDWSLDARGKLKLSNAMLCRVQGMEDITTTIVLVVPALSGLPVQWAGLEDLDGFCWVSSREPSWQDPSHPMMAGSLERNLYTSLWKIYHLAFFSSLDLPWGSTS